MKASNKKYWLLRVDHSGGGCFVYESASLGEIIVMIGEFVRDGEFPEDFRIEEWTTDPASGENTHRIMKLSCIYE